MKRQTVLVSLAAAMCCVALPAAAAIAASRDNEEATEVTAVKRALAGMSVPFEQNQGQFDRPVAYAARTFAGTVFVTRKGQIVHSLAGKSSQDDGAAIKAEQRATRGAGWTLVETLAGAHVRPQGGTASPTQVTRIIGNDPGNWRSQIATYSTVRLGEPWPGIEMELSARGANVEKLFTVAPGADADRIRVELAGARTLRTGAGGSLVVDTGNGAVTFTAPVAWQDIGGDRRPVQVAYAVKGKSYGFHVGSYDHAYPVLIDPLLQATYVGGSGDDGPQTFALGPGGDVYVAGNTDSTNFPGTAGGAQTGNGGGADAFVVRINSSLTAILRATYLGGSGMDQAFGLTVDGAGNVYVAGSTASTDFPATAGAAFTTFRGGASDGFVARLSGDLSSLMAATFLGGSGHDSAEQLTVDNGGNVYVSGDTDSAIFPATAGGAQSAYSGASLDGFVARLNANLSSLTQATYLGGNGADRALWLALDGSGSLYVTGDTTSTDFPGVTGGAQGTNGGAHDAYVARLNTALTSLVQSTYVGGSADDFARNIVVNGSGIYIAGTTASIDLPGVAGGAQTVSAGGTDVFVARLNANLTSLIQATYLGGSAAEGVNGLAIDGGGNVYVAGPTRSTDFPGTAGGVQSAYGGGFQDAFIARLDPSLTSLSRATYLGSTGDDFALGIAIDGSGAIVVAGATSSTTFPGTAGGAQTAHGGAYYDGFVARLTADLLASAQSATPVPGVSGWHLAMLAILLAGLAGLAAKDSASARQTKDGRAYAGSDKH